MKIYIIKIILAIFLLSIFAQASSNKNTISIAIGETIGRSLSYEQKVSNKKINVNINNIQDTLSKNMIERGFLLNTVNINRYEEKGKIFNVFGVLVHTDRINRFIQTKFEAVCIVKNRKNYSIQSLKLSNNTRPETVFFIVPKDKIKIESLKKLSFIQAFEKVKSVARSLNSSDMIPINYKMITFIFGKVDEKDKVYSTVSSKSYDMLGESGDNIETNDKWNILVSDGVFAYDGDDVQYLNIFWETNGYHIPIASYSTQRIFKAMQIALQRQGYDVGYVDGEFNNRTKDAVKKYLKKAHFYSRSKIDDNLLWFMQQPEQIDISKTVQLLLLQHGINIGAIDGKVGPGTISGLKKYQKKIGLKRDGKVTPELVRLLVKTSNVLDVHYYVSTFFNNRPSINRYENKMWPEELQ